MTRDSNKLVSYKKGFGCWWVVMGVVGYILAGGGWWGVVAELIWLVVGGVGWW